MILGQKAREQQAVPMLIRRQLAQMVKLLATGTRIARITQGPTPRPQPIPQPTLLIRHVRPGFRLMHRQILQRRPTA